MKAIRSVRELKCSAINKKTKFQVWFHDFLPDFEVGDIKPVCHKRNLRTAQLGLLNSGFLHTHCVLGLPNQKSQELQGQKQKVHGSRNTVMRCTADTCTTRVVFLCVLDMEIWTDIGDWYNGVEWPLESPANLLSLKISLSCWQRGTYARKVQVLNPVGKTKAWKIAVDYHVNFICYKSRWGLFPETNECMHWTQ